MTPAFNVVHEVATLVSRAYVARGSKYDPQDVYQDAAETALVAAKNYDPGKGTVLAGYLYHAAWRHCSDRITRMCQPAGTRSNSEVKQLRNLKTVVVHESHVGADPLDYDRLIYLTQVRARMDAVAATVPEGDTALRIVLGLTSVSEEAAGDSERSKRLYYCVRRMKKALREDPTLADMAK